MERKVLIIDDDSLFRRTLKYGLQDDTTSVYYAESVQEAMLCFAQNNYALIIMDTQLTETDGISMLGVIRQAKLSVPIMILTSTDNLMEQLLALEIGADVVLEKLTDPLEYIIGHARALMLRNEERRNAASYQPIPMGVKPETELFPGFGRRCRICSASCGDKKFTRTDTGTNGG